MGHQPNFLKCVKKFNQFFWFPTQTTGLIFTLDKSIRFLEQNSTFF